MLGRDAPHRCQRTAGRVDAAALDGGSTAIADIKDAAVRAYREARWPTGGGRLADWRKFAGAGVDTEPHDLVIVLQADVQHVRHVVPPSSFIRARSALRAAGSGAADAPGRTAAPRRRPSPGPGAPRRSHPPRCRR